jgi:hypothetical protein
MLGMILACCQLFVSPQPLICACTLSQQKQMYTKSSLNWTQSLLENGFVQVALEAKLARRQIQHVYRHVILLHPGVLMYIVLG